MTCPPVSDAVPGELGDDEHQEDEEETDDPDHGVSAVAAVTGAHISIRGVLSGTHGSLKIKFKIPFSGRMRKYCWSIQVLF